MATGKKFYWLKLKEQFMNSDEVDFLLSQKNGSDYLAIYLLLSIKTINNNGVLATSIGEVIVPYDVEKIQRDCKYFNVDTIMVALDLFKKLGLVYQQDNGALCIVGYDELVGNQTDYATQKAIQRKNKDKLLSVDNSVDNVHIEKEIEKEIENRDKEIDKDIKKVKRFSKPTLEEIENYITLNNINVDANHFYDYYEANGWLVGKNKMKDWKATIRNWSRRNVVQNKDKITPRWENEKKQSNEEMDYDISFLTSK